MNSNYSLVKNSVCSVVSDLGSGTGWLYRRTNNKATDKTIYVVTAAHMVIERDESGNETIYNPSVLIQNVNGSGNNQIFDTQVISIDRKGDVAILNIVNHRGTGNKYPNNWPSHISFPVVNTVPEIGSQIYIVGYPEGFDYNSFAGGYLRENNASEYFTPTSLYYNLATSPGNSGSPVFNTSNKVIGMLQWGTEGEEMDGGLRSDLLYYVIEKMITTYVSSGKTLYNSIFKKQAIDLFDDSLTSFIPLNTEIIKFLQQYDIANAYNNGGRVVNGVLLIHDEYLTSLVIETITYTNYNNVSKTITLSSSVFNKTSIWEVLYFAKENSNITMSIYDADANSSSSVTVQLKEMPKEIDYFLTSGFSKKIFKKAKEDNEIKDKIKISTESLKEKIKTKSINQNN